jgi:Holliday junction DNA helicase RuvB
MQGYIKRTAQGRVAMPKAYKKLGLPAPKSAPDSPSQPDLFKA